MHMAVKTASIAVGALAFITTFSACSSSQEAVSSSTTASAAAGIDRQAGNLGTRVCIVNESTRTANVVFTKRDTARGEGSVAPGNQACGEGTFFQGFDVDGTGGKAYRLYQAAFDRVPDEGGVGFWMYYIDRGFNLIDAAANFMGSAEFKELYGDNPSNEQFMNLLYANVMNRTPDDGYYFWLDALYGRGQFEGTVSSRPFVLQRFSESAENQANVIGVITDGFQYEVFAPPV